MPPISRISCEHVLPLLLSLTDANVESSFTRVLANLGVNEDAQIPGDKLDELPTLIHIAAIARPSSHRPLAKFVSLVFNMLPPPDSAPFADRLGNCPPFFVAGLVAYNVLRPRDGDLTDVIPPDYWRRPGRPASFLGALLADSCDYFTKEWRPGKRAPIWLQAEGRLDDVPVVVAAAYYGASRCFSYLMQKQVDPDPSGPLTSVQAAIIGGDRDIIRILGQKRLRFDTPEAWQAAAKYHRTATLANVGKAPPAGLFEFCVSCGNTDMLKTHNQNMPEQFEVTAYG